MTTARTHSFKGAMRKITLQIINKNSHFRKFNCKKQGNIWQEVVINMQIFVWKHTHH